MHLASVTVKGFKSFADPVRLDLEPGVTAVVGPNGSGKSNVVDAISWVLGAQGPRTVRSARMDDVIFAGTADRPPLGRAEVGITLDNSDRMLGLDLTEIHLRRTLFRDGDSEYALNGVPCRLLDIQELLSDAGVGRSQHVIVAQGQIDAVLAARGEERRAVVEEAAGVLKFRRRKEKAERRLAATEGNLLRLQDLLREVRRQLRPLERQAEAARRHGELADEVGALRLHVLGQEIVAQTARRRRASTARDELAEAQRDRRRQLARLDVGVAELEDRLRSSDHDAAAEHLTRLEALTERLAGVRARLAERARALARDRDALLDEAVVASLEADSARLTEELAQLDAAAAEVAPVVDEVAAAEAALSADRARFEAADPAAAGVGPGDGEAAALRVELAARRQAADRVAGERDRAGARRDELARRAAKLAEESGSVAARRRTAEEQVGERARSAAAAATGADTAEAAAADAGSTAEAASMAASAAGARVEALVQAVSSAAAVVPGGASDGVLGTLLDVVDVDAGWEAAVAAALGPAVRAAVTADAERARSLLSTLRDDARAGAVLPLGLAPGGSGPRGGGEPVRAHVRGSRPGVDGLLDRLLGGAVRIDDRDAAARVAEAHPDRVVVTGDGDRYGPDGWRTGVDPATATGAALDAARRDAGAATATAASAVRLRQEAAARVTAARRERTAAAVAVEEARRALARAEADAQRLDAEAAQVDAERARTGERLTELDAELEAAWTGLADRERRLPAAEEAEAERLHRAERLDRERRALQERERTLAARRQELQVRLTAIEERRTLTLDRHRAVEARLDRHGSEREAARARREAIDDDLALVADAQRVLDGWAPLLGAEREEARAAQRARTDANRAAAAELEGLRRRRAELERSTEEDAERVRRHELDEAEARLRIEQLADTVRAELDVEPDVAVGAPRPELPDGVAPAARLRELDRELKLLGPVNPLALEEHRALAERATFLADQLDDVRSSRRELHKVLRSVDDEIVHRFAVAFEAVATHFERLFEVLFPRGTGRLTLGDPGDLLSTGVEIEARPSGKNVRTLSLLSGGERALTALAFLFAVFRAHPSPFYVLDEVEAALDDVNLHRFLSLVQEFRHEAQLVVVTHQKRTMEAADCLYGVSMQPGGSSQVVSERVSTPA